MSQLHLITDYEFSSKLTTGNRKGRIDSVWYEGKGDCFAIVSHREDLQVEKRDYGAFVACEDFADHLFRSGARQKKAVRRLRIRRESRSHQGMDSSFCIGRDPGKGICRYAVSAVNLCGEGEKSPFDLNDDPASLRNYKALADRLFNRNSLYNHHPFTARNTLKFREVPSSYPDSVR